MDLLKIFSYFNIFSKEYRNIAKEYDALLQDDNISNALHNPGYYDHSSLSQKGNCQYYKCLSYDKNFYLNYLLFSIIIGFIKFKICFIKTVCATFVFHSHIYYHTQIFGVSFLRYFRYAINPCKLVLFISSKYFLLETNIEE